MGGVGNGVTDQDPGWDLNRKVGRRVGQRQCGTIPGCAGKKAVKRLSLMDHKEVPRSFGLRTGDPRDTAGGVGNLGGPAQRSTGYWKEPGEVSLGLLFFLLGGGTSDQHVVRLA